jgi:hypothetical protein
MASIEAGRGAGQKSAIAPAWFGLFAFAVGRVDTPDDGDVGVLSRSAACPEVQPKGVSRRIGDQVTRVAVPAFILEPVPGVLTSLIF